MAERERILVLNIGSTSSKIAVFDDDTELFRQTIRHTKEELGQFRDVLEQFDFRTEKIMDALRENGVPMESLTCVCSTGGNILPCPHGAIEISQDMVDYLTRPDDSARHPSLIGSVVAFEFHKKYGIPALVYDAIGTDEILPVARVSGVPEIPHFMVGHTLNTRAVAIRCAEEVLGKKLEDCTFIVAHLGGGSSVRLIQKGITIDCVNDDDGNFTPERCGVISAKRLVDLCFSGKYTKKEMNRMMHGAGGLKAHLNTADVVEIEKMVADGDEYAKVVYEALPYNVAKDIGRLAAVVCGKVDRIILTGGIAFSEYISQYIIDHVSFIAPVEVMAGEFEMEALAAGALRAMHGEEELQNFADIKAASVDRIRLVPELEPGAINEKYFK